MSARDVTGGISSNYVLPSAVGGAGQALLAPSAPTGGLNQLVWGAPAPELAATFTLIMLEPGGNGSTSSVSGSIFRSGNLITMCALGPGTGSITMVGTAGGASGLLAMLSNPIPFPPGSPDMSPLPWVNWALPLRDETGFAFYLNATGFLGQLGDVRAYPSDGTLTFAAGRVFTLMGFSVSWVTGPPAGVPAVGARKVRMPAQPPPALLPKILAWRPPTPVAAATEDAEYLSDPDAPPSPGWDSVASPLSGDDE